jgi:hypothetical protein
MTTYTLHVPSIRGATEESPPMPYDVEDSPMDDVADVDDYVLSPRRRSRRSRSTTSTSRSVTSTSD